MRECVLIIIFSCNFYILNGQGIISFSYSAQIANGEYYEMKGSVFSYKNMDELIEILRNPPDTIEQIVIEDNNITKLPAELYKLKQTRSIQLISTSITDVDKNFNRMDNLEIIECVLDSIGDISIKLYRSKKLSIVSIEGINKTESLKYNPNLNIKLPQLVQKYDKRKRYFRIMLGDVIFETKTFDTPIE